MYKVKMDNRYIYHPWDKTLQINDPKLETELNKNGHLHSLYIPIIRFIIHLQSLKQG